MRMCGSHAALLILLVLLAPALASAVSVGQVDSFESGTTESWTVGLGFGSPHPAPPDVVVSGGPAGADDAFLLVHAVGGADAGSRLTVMNPAQWAGDYSAAGVTSISMDVVNLGATDLLLRLLFENPVAGPPTAAAYSAEPIFLPAGGGWTSVVFSVMAGDLLPEIGSIDAALASATILRIFHGAADDFPGEPITASLGIDNIRAVPEPGVATLLGTGLSILAGRRRRNRPTR